MQNTTNYNLNKPDGSDYAKIQALNENADIIDNQLKTLSDDKVDKVNGKQLSTNDYTTTEKNKLAGIATGANNITVNNTLTSTSTTAALSAAQGKELKDLVDAKANNMDLTALSNAVTTHLGETKTGAHKAKNITLEDADDLFVGTELESAMKELFINVSNGKQLVGTAITDTDPSKTVPSNPTFQQLANLITAINTGKKFVQGSFSNDTSGINTIVGMGFRPTHVFIWRGINNSTANGYKGFFVNIAGQNYPGLNFNPNFSNLGTDVVFNAFTILPNGFTVNTGFKQVSTYYYFALE